VLSRALIAAAPKIFRHSLRPFGWAASMLAVVAVGYWSVSSLPTRELPAKTQVVQTIRQEVLPDGSRIDLAAKSSVAVNYTNDERTLELEQGEAYFTVAHNRARPFVVKVGNLRVRAVGTAFNVRRVHDRVVVAVTDGVVDMYSVEQTHPSSATPKSVRVTVGNQVAWGFDRQEPMPVTPVDVAHALAWREGRLEYVNESLRAVIEDVNRYASRKVIIEDQAVGEIAYSGTVFTHETEMWLSALPRVFPVDVSTDSSGNAVLRLRSGGEPAER
jgi:transmembrane sensor